MADVYRYPAQEHYEFPQTSVDVIESELHYYPTPREFMVNLRVLNDQLRSYRLVTDLRTAAVMVDTSIQRTKNHIEPAAEGPDQPFYGGEILAVHSIFNVLPTVKRQLLDMSILMYTDSNDIHAAAHNRYEDDVRYLDDYRRTGWLDDFCTIEPRLQEKVIEAGHRIYDGQPDGGSSVARYCAGYVFAAAQVALLDKQSGGGGYESE